MRLTIRDIAKMAGVSPATVSKIMNNYDGISAETTERVKRVIDETGYKPTFSAQSLATKKSNLIGIIYAGEINVDLNHPFFNEVINVFKKTVGSLGYDLLIFSNEKFNMEKENYLLRARHFHVDGCLIVAGEKIESAIYELDQSDVPCVGVDIQLTGRMSSYVMTDNVRVAAKVVEHLYLNSIRDIAYIGGKRESPIAQMRLDGFASTMQKFGIPIKEEWVHFGDFFEESGRASMARMLKTSPYPKAVFAASDMMALGAIHAIKERGLKVPDDIRVIGCDDIEACRYSEPKLTTIKQDKEKLGKFAGHMLNDLITKKMELKAIQVDPELIIRESCGAYRNAETISIDFPGDRF
ncbi:LacI family transcriptional regulator [Evansella caseinilytica]|uniref:LacI family transcriptional regulator n=1 Tax=Evansella caseinilytica TaxID=1503961 RepID=A0A1H3ILF3_9BACI|nr:LacI family DNA-binding transcriptional regulator [Evansella caseinilytica]SDY27654.1 LacI family transcriptional regulator [Evansella caseinilytica]